VYKCVINKDGTGSPPSNGQAQNICKQSDAIPLTAWAEAIGDEGPQRWLTIDFTADPRWL